MSITLDLPQDLESELSAEAARLGLSLSEYALRVLLTRRTRGGTVPQTGAELVAYWQRQGVIGTRGDIANSQEHARQLRHQAERRVQE
jgi:tryptophan synthase alpha subunit